MLQIWAKQQPKGAMAVLVLNSDDASVNHTVSVDFRSLNLTASSYNVRDIWLQRDLNPAKAQLNTDPIPGHDSRFYLLTPQ